ncbi:Myosin light polypeptide 6 [Coelomomyces lativittatus]|nr:Myosin light polypeptide 6 [Coelomomyces lativittatus]KAJ1504242.1 Myosin light polypeptide 6 [Coelomomyces lativittatus]KAJ1512892.1 Myosin light polypeptide 6 [Coelomomyces lativittatus]
MISTVEFSEEQQKEFRETFSLFDKKGDGYVELKFIGDLLRALGKNPTEFQVTQIVNNFQQQAITKINLENVLNIIDQSDELKSFGTLDEFKQGFQVFDKDGTGYISEGELKYVLTSLGEKLSPNEVNDLLKHTDIVKEGLVNYEEFTKAILNS